jgi:hypothetical protein
MCMADCQWLCSCFSGATLWSASLSVEEGSLPWYREDECESPASGPLIVHVGGTYCAINTPTLRERQGSRRGMGRCGRMSYVQGVVWSAILSG